MSELHPPPKPDERSEPTYFPESWLVRPSPLVGRRRLLTAATVLAFTIAALIALLPGAREPDASRSAVVARLTVSGDPDRLAIGFGSVWVPDDIAGRITRIDAENHAVVGHIRARSPSTVSVGLGAVWANAHGELLKIDPGHNRVLARVPFETPDGAPYKTFDIYSRQGTIWLVAPRRAARVDPRTLTVRGWTVLGEGFVEVTSSAATSSGLWTLTTAGRLERYDWRTGARTDSVPAPVNAPTTIVASRRDVLVLNAVGDVARVDASTARPSWRITLPVHPGAAGAADDRLFVKGSDTSRPRDLLLAVDIRTGHTLARSAMTDLGSDGPIRVAAKEVWMTAYGGKVIAARF